MQFISICREGWVEKENQIAPDKETDLDLIEAANRGDASALERLYTRHRAWVAGLAYRFTRNHDDALDVLQETFLYFFGKFPGFRLTARLTTFLYPVVKNISLSKMRRRAFAVIDETVEDQSPAPHEAVDSHSDVEVLLSVLSDAQREVVVMRFVDGFSLAEISEAIDVPIGTVKSRLHSALERLKNSPAAKKFLNG